jgi:hypothetical protein
MTPKQEAAGQRAGRKRTSLEFLDKVLNPLKGGTGVIHVYRWRGTNGRYYDVFEISDNRPTWISMHLHNVLGYGINAKRECLSSGYESLGSDLRTALGFGVSINTF